MTDNRIPSISVIIPVYNGGQTIAPLADKLTQVFAGRPFQIVLINDGSQDDSAGVCREIVRRFPSAVTFLDLSMNFGEHNAVMAGLRYAKCDYAVIMDDDFQNPPEEALRLVESADACGHDVVYGVYKKKRHGPLRNLGSLLNSWMAAVLLKKPRGLYLSSFKCLNRFVINEITQYHGPYPYIDGLILRCTRRIGTVAVEHYPRREGRSGYTCSKLIRLWMNMFTNFSVSPLRMSSLLGFCLSGLGMVLSVFVIAEKILRPHIQVGWASLFIGIMVFSGVQLIMLGLIGEYIGRLFLSINQTPQYVVREVLQPPQT